MRVLIASKIHQKAIDELSKDHEVSCAFNAGEDELKSKIKGCETLIFRSGVTISADVMKCSPDLKLLIRAGSGFDNVDIDYVNANGLTLYRIPEPGAKAVAEMAFALMLALSRNLMEADEKLRKGHWAKNELTGYLLTGKVLGIIGAGNIGSRVGQMGAAWGMEVIGCVENPDEMIAENLKHNGLRLTGFDEVIARSDYLSLHVPLTESTRYLIGNKEFERMKKGSFLINLSRGGVVDEPALYAALTGGDRLRAAALDVHENEGHGKISPLAHLPNVILTPHIGAGTIDTQLEIADRILTFMDGYFSQYDYEKGVKQSRMVI